MEDSLPDILRDLSATLDAELTGNPLAAVELDADARAALVSLSARPTPAKAAVAAAGAKPAASSIAVTVTQPPAPPPMPPKKPAPVPASRTRNGFPSAAGRWGRISASQRAALSPRSSTRRNRPKSAARRVQ